VKHELILETEATVEERNVDDAEFAVLHTSVKLMEIEVHRSKRVIDPNDPDDYTQSEIIAVENFIFALRNDVENFIFALRNELL